MYVIRIWLKIQERLSLSFSFAHCYIRHGSGQFNQRQSNQDSEKLAYILLMLQLLSHLPHPKQQKTTSVCHQHQEMTSLRTSLTSGNDQPTSSTSGNNQPTSSTSGNNQSTSQITVSEKERSCSSGTTFEDSTISFTEDQITLFERRYDNGYNLYHDKVYVAWLQQEHPECLPKDPDICPVIENTNIDYISQSDNSLAEVQSLSENLSESSVQESSGTSPMDVQAPTKSLSVSLSQTRSLLLELSEFLDKPKAPAKAKGKTTKARVLTSAESLSLLIEKEKKKKKRRKQKKREKRSEKEKEKKEKLRSKEKLKSRKSS